MQEMLFGLGSGVGEILQAQAGGETGEGRRWLAEPHAFSISRMAPLTAPPMSVASGRVSRCSKRACGLRYRVLAAW